jgi:RHS repeat-associated protein
LLNRVISKSYNDGPQTPTAEFFYDEAAVTLGSWTSPGLNYPNGRLTHTTTMSGSTLLTGTAQDYDPMGRTYNYWQCTAPLYCGSGIWAALYNYDLAGDVTSWNHPAGYTITNTISPARRITEISSSLNDATHPPALAQSITYTPWGALSTLVNGAPGGGTGAQETYQYNNRLQPVMIELGTTGNHTADYCLVYNYYSGVSNPLGCTTPSQGTTNNGNVVGYRYQDNVNPPSFSHTASYIYDGVNRLSTATAKTMSGSTIWSQTYGSQSYSHPDQWGNWTCSGSGACPSLTWNSQNNHLLTIGVNNPLPFSYDAAGNLTYDPSNLSAHTYQWDAEGRVASVDSGSTWSFTYNALGYRVQWASPSGGELHLFDPEGNWLGNANSYTLVRFGERALVISTGSETDFNHINNIGSTTMWTNHTGSPVEDIVFYPWGDVWLGSGGYNFAYLPYRDLSTTTDITTARFISPNFGRWFSPDPEGQDAADPSDPQTWNMYAYVRNNPTTLTDPSGLELNCTGDQCRRYLTELSKTTGMQFSIDKKGNTTVTSRPEQMSTVAQKVDQIIADKQTVRISADSHNVVVGGQFGGSGKQYLNYNSIDQISAKGGFTPGSITIHETVEAYAGLHHDFGTAHNMGVDYENLVRLDQGLGARIGEFGTREGTNTHLEFDFTFVRESFDVNVPWRDVTNVQVSSIVQVPSPP